MFPVQLHSLVKTEANVWENSSWVVLSTRTKSRDPFSMRVLIAQWVEHMTGNQRVMGCVIF